MSIQNHIKSDVSAKNAVFLPAHRHRGRPSAKSTRLPTAVERDPIVSPPFGLAISRHHNPEAQAALLRALQWLCAAEQERKPEHRLACVDEALSCLTQRGLTVRTVLDQLPEAGRMTWTSSVSARSTLPFFPGLISIPGCCARDRAARPRVATIDHRAAILPGYGHPAGPTEDCGRP